MPFLWSADVAFIDSSFGVGVTAQLASLALTFLFAVNSIYISANDQASLGPASNNKVSYWACAIWPSLVFYITMAVYNAVATLLVPVLAPGLVAREVFDPLDGLSRAIVYAIVGTVGFEAILSNLTFSTVGVNYSFRDRITKARDRAVEEALDRQIQIDNRKQQKCARALRELVSEEDLNTHIITLLGGGRVTALDEQAEQENAHAFGLKADVLAAQKPDEANAIVREARRARKSRGRLPRPSEDR